MVPSAELRLYQPLHAFPRSEQVAWERWLVGGRRSAPARYRDVPTLPGIGLFGPAGTPGRALVVGGTTYVSADRSRMQALAATVALREVPPFDVPVVAAAQARRARRALRRLRRRHPGRTPMVMTDAWGVPPRWFLLFDDAERRLVTSPELSLTYRTTARKALDRLERVVPLLRGLGLSSEEHVDLYRWIAGVHPRSLVVLDYAGLCGLLRWDELDDDHSARDSWEAIEALASRETERSIDIAATVAARFAPLRARESLN